MSYLLNFIILPLDSKLGLYFLMFSVLVISGIGLPIPEEMTLVLGGYLAYLEFVDLYATLAVLFLGTIGADIVGYLIGKYAGNWVSSKISRLKIFRDMLEKARRWFDTYGEKVVILSRPFMGARVLVPMFAGHFRMNFIKFILFDIIGAIPWTIFLVSLSYYLGIGLDLLTEIREVKHAVYLIILGVIGAVALRKSLKYLDKKVVA